MPVSSSFSVQGTSQILFITTCYRIRYFFVPLAASLQEAVVRSKKSELILRSGIEYVVDYEFVGENILVASYCGNNGRKAKLFILNNNGDTIRYSKIDIAPEELFRSCVGRYYVVSYDGIYPILAGSESSSLSLGERMPLNDFLLLKECQVYANEKFYYKIKNKDYLTVIFAYAEKNDNTFIPFKNVEDPATLYTSIEELSWVAQGDDPSTRFSRAMSRKMWNDATFKRMDASIFAQGDTLLIFDFHNRKVDFYSPYGILLKDRPMLFFEGDLLFMKVIQDQVTGRYYILNEKGKSTNITEINIAHGVATANSFELEKPYAEKVMIKNNNIYYLWQSGKGSVKQLYIQRNTVK